MSQQPAGSLGNRPAAARQRGVSIISALFMLLLFAALAAYMVSLSSSSNISAARDVQGARAYQAAQAGLEWGLLQVLDPANSTVAAMVAPFGSGTAAWPNMPDCPATSTLALGGFTVVVQCARFPAGGAGASGPPVYSEAGATRSVIVYQLTSTASSAGAVVGTLAYVERQVAASASKCRALDGLAPAYLCQ